ncbi:hypothetical protein SAMN05444164_6902 [Bradyrhizobium erythrophlei]|uniref:Uncharacterized protein n=1 Tax=Bradyrhizobium erythrophlei TaxID=1437360 RepID=A0A1H5G2V1_9BRAD|nr:hypothetical protein SAMN05444164_6902 [Bradyrhizobium erythrophlei]
MFNIRRTLSAAVLSLGLVPAANLASAADLPVKAPADLPFFLVIDDRVTYSYIFSGTDPGVFSVRPDGSINGKTAKQVYSFTHFDIWASVAFEAVVRSRTKGGNWRTFEAPPCRLRCASIRKQGLRNNGSSDVTVSRYQNAVIYQWLLPNAS